MVWFKVDDGFYTSRKVLSIPRRHRLAAVGLWTLAGNWSARELTDGKVPSYVLEELGATETSIRALVDARLWLDRRSTNPRPSLDQGSPHIEFKNWGEYQPTRDDVEAERVAARERQRKRRRNQRSGQFEETPSQGTHGEVTPESRRDTTVSHGGSHTTPSRPDPTRPDQTPTESRATRGTRLPDDFTPTPEHADRATDNNLNLDRELTKFRAHAEEKARTAKNWNAAFTRWLMNAADYQRRDNAPRQSTTDQRYAQGMAVVARLEDNGRDTNRRELTA